MKYAEIKKRRLNIPEKVFNESWAIYQALSPEGRKRNGLARYPEFTLEYDYIHGIVLKHESKVKEVSNKRLFTKEK